MSLFTDWAGDTLTAAWVKRRLDQPGSADADAGEFFGTPRGSDSARFMDAPDDNLTPLLVPGPWSERLPHFRLDATPSNGDEIQTEYFVPRDQGAAALAARSATTAWSASASAPRAKPPPEADTLVGRARCLRCGHSGNRG